jgi:DNA-binding transcriptional ArsR family regulator
VNDESFIKGQVDQDLMLMYKAGLVDVKMREDGQWVYFATDYAKSLSDEQLNEIFENMSSQFDTEV